MQNTREHLIDTGLQLIHANGYGMTGVKDVLDQAKIPKGSFYHYFPSKEAFAEEVLQRYAAREVARWKQILGNDKLPPLKRLRIYFEELLSIYGQAGPISGCLIGNLSLEVASQSINLQLLLSESFKYWQQAISDVLRSAVERDDLPPSTRPDQLAAFLLNSWEGALVRSKADKSDAPLQLFLQITFQTLLKSK